MKNRSTDLAVIASDPATAARLPLPRERLIYFQGRYHDLAAEMLRTEVEMAEEMEANLKQQRRDIASQRRDLDRQEREVGFQEGNLEAARQNLQERLAELPKVSGNGHRATGTVIETTPTAAVTRRNGRSKKGPPAEETMEAGNGEKTKTKKPPEAGPREGSKARVLFDEITRHGSKGIPSPALIDFAVADKTINPGREERDIVKVRVSAMIQSLRKSSFVKNIGEEKKAIWHSESAVEAAVKPLSARTEGPPRKTVRPDSGLPPVKSDLRELQQSFLNGILHGKKKGLTLDQIVAASRESSYSGFVNAGDDDNDVRFKIGQFLQMSRQNYACDSKLPPHWWIKEEAPRPFAGGRK